MSKQIALLVGSNSATSFNKIVANYIKSIAPASLQINIVEIADLPLYDRDLDANSPEQYTRLRNQIAAADGVLFVSPEHNGALPAMLKNAIDVVSRPMGESKWIGKPTGFITVVASLSGGVRVSDQLRLISSAPFINMPALPFAANIGGIFNGVFNDKGEIASDAVKETLQNFIKAYADFVEKF
ncbi:FMN reductase [Pasteurellaceae bacterium Pebbles2]|nr:FMN reductase [Pasteurellaceae bacterium Pebbles2]